MALVPQGRADARGFIQRVLDHEFEDLAVLSEALDTTGMRKPESNHRLAMLGDALLKHTLLEEWYIGNASKVVGNNLVSTLGSNARLAHAARQIGLAPYLIVHPGHRGPVSARTLATTIEALLGAICMDSDKDMMAVKTAMGRLDLTPTASY